MKSTKKLKNKEIENQLEVPKETNNKKSVSLISEENNKNKKRQPEKNKNNTNKKRKNAQGSEPTVSLDTIKQAPFILKLSLNQVEALQSTQNEFPEKDNIKLLICQNKDHYRFITLAVLTQILGSFEKASTQSIKQIILKSCHHGIFKKPLIREVNSDIAAFAEKYSGSTSRHCGLIDLDSLINLLNKKSTEKSKKKSHTYYQDFLNLLEEEIKENRVYEISEESRKIEEIEESIEESDENIKVSPEEEFHKTIPIESPFIVQLNLNQLKAIKYNFLDNNMDTLICKNKDHYQFISLGALTQILNSCPGAPVTFISQTILKNCVHGFLKSWKKINAQFFEFIQKYSGSYGLIEISSLLDFLNKESNKYYPVLIEKLNEEIKKNNFYKISEENEKIAGIKNIKANFLISNINKQSNSQSTFFGNKYGKNQSISIEPTRNTHDNLPKPIVNSQKTKGGLFNSKDVSSPNLSDPTDNTIKKN